MNEDKEKTEEAAEAVEAANGDATSNEHAAQADGANDGEASDGAAEEAGQPSETDRLLGEIEALKERNMRLLADFDNFRRRTAREKNETYGRAKESVIEDLLPVIDNFALAMASAPESDPFADGVRMVHAQIAEFLAKEGVTVIEAVGAKFDPALHDAIAYQPSGEVAEGDILFEAKKGYRLGDRVIRPASVIVSSGKPAAEASGNEDAAATDGTEA